MTPTPPARGHNSDGRWIVNPMFIEPNPQADDYPCSTKGAVDKKGNDISARDDSGAVIPDQVDTVFVAGQD